MAKVKDVLSISTAVKRRIVVIDGKKLELLNQEELRLDAAVRLRVVLAAFRDRSVMSEQGALALSQGLARAVRDVLPGLPQEIDAKLSDEQRIDICIAFFKATGSPAPRTAAAPLPVKS